jgi:hypothetical protein
MAFEQFTKTGRGYTPKASIWMRGQIGFNRGAVEKFRIRDFEYAMLFYDKETDRIGIKFTNDSKMEGIAKLAKSAASAFISARAFLQYYDIPHDKTTKYDIAYDKESELYVIDMQKKS